MTQITVIPLTTSQREHLMEMARKEEWGDIHIHGQFTLPTGETFFQFSKGTDVAPPVNMLQHTYTLYALPVHQLGVQDVLLYELPRACFNVVPPDTPPYPFKAMAIDWVAQNYYQVTKKEVVAIELEHIKTEKYKRKGLGTHLLRWGIACALSLCLEYGKSPAYVYGEVVPEVDSQLPDLLRFYSRNGFRKTSKWVYLPL